MIGYIPQMAIFALMGKGIVVQSYWKIALSVGLLGVSALLSIYLYKQFKAGALNNDNVNDSDTAQDASTTQQSGQSASTSV